MWMMRAFGNSEYTASAKCSVWSDLSPQRAFATRSALWPWNRAKSRPYVAGPAGTRVGCVPRPDARCRMRRYRTMSSRHRSRFVGVFEVAVAPVEVAPHVRSPHHAQIRVRCEQREHQRRAAAIRTGNEHRPFEIDVDVVDRLSLHIGIRPGSRTRRCVVRRLRCTWAGDSTRSRVAIGGAVAAFVSIC